jgi:hypothetical protein
MPMPPNVMQAFGQGGGAPAPSPYQVPAGIPDPRVDAMMQQTMAPQGMPMMPPGVGPSVDLRALLRSGAISAEQLLAIVAMLAGMGGAPQGPAPAPDMMDAFTGGGGGYGEAEVQ